MECHSFWKLFLEGSGLWVGHPKANLNGPQMDSSNNSKYIGVWNQNENHINTIENPHEEYKIWACYFRVILWIVELPLS